ncbi:MAG: CsbD family protein [Chloroflexota bacterium]
MNKDIFEGKWKQVRGEARSWWGKLTDDDLDRVAGKYDSFIGLLQEKYGYTHEQATNEIHKHLTDFETAAKKKMASIK